MYAVIVAYSVLTWFGFHAWRQLARAYRARSSRLAAEEGVARGRQLRGLLLAIGRGIPPSAYYGLALHRHPPARWWSFVFDHELPHWHLVLQPRPPSEFSHRLLNDKGFFAAEMERRGLPAVPVAESVPAGDEPCWARLLGGGDWFFKPVSGARAEGCFALVADPETGEPRLERGDEGWERGEQAIRDAIRERIRERDYLIQPFLRSRAELLALVDGREEERVTTVRVVTGWCGGGAEVVAATLELNGSARRRWKMHAVGATTGELEMNGRRAFLPDWEELVGVVAAAHDACPDILTVGWDIVITEDGPQLLEANLNWGAQAHQVGGRPPLLEGPLLSLYSTLGETHGNRR